MINWIMSAPILVKVLCSLGLILICNALFRQLAVAVGIGALILGLWCGFSLQSIGGLALHRLISTNNLGLLVIIFQVIWLSSQMSRTGLMEQLVLEAKARVSREGAMAVLPAVIGFLPMPGGALFSAPLVDSCDAGDNVGGGLKAQANHWFRHVWEYWWPLYPGVLLAMEIIGWDVWQMFLMGLPLTVGAFLTGYFFILRPIARQEQHPHESAGTSGGDSLLIPLSPILIVVATYAVIRLGYPAVQSLGYDLPSLNRYLPLAIGLFLAIQTLQTIKPLKPNDWKEILLSTRTLNMALIVAMVRIYGAFIEADLPSGAPLVEEMRAEMMSWGIPLLAVIMLLPLVSGLATGLSIGFVGASFPIVLQLVPPEASFTHLTGIVVLAYAFGYMGMLLSPVHVCLIVTCEHFDEPLNRPVGGMIRPAVCMLLWGLILYFLWYAGPATLLG